MILLLQKLLKWMGIYVLQSKPIVNYMVKKATNGTTIANLTVDDIKNIEISLPNIEIQQRRIKKNRRIYQPPELLFELVRTRIRSKEKTKRLLR